MARERKQESKSDQNDELPHLDNEIGLVPCGASTSKQPDHVPIEMHGGASNAVGDIREETPRNADQGREEPATEDFHERDEWVVSIQRKVYEYTGSQEAETETISIPRVPKGPRGFVQAVEKAFEPRVISIGPYHREKPHLKNMQKRKWQCLKHISDNSDLIKDLLEGLKKEENRARSFYPAESNNQLKRGDFLEMLLLDGYFIVHFLCPPRPPLPRPPDEPKTKIPKPKMTEITKIWSDHQIRNDLLLLENQLPFFVLECIYRLVKETNDNKKLVQIAMKLFQNISPKALTVHEPKEGNFKHLLHLYHAYIFFENHDDWKKEVAFQVDDLKEEEASQERKEEEASQERKEQEASQVLTIPSAILLEKAGIKFKKRKNDKDRVIDVRFRGGVMNITPLVIDAFTISRFLNLIEFERAHPNMEPRFTAFVQFMDYIINTSEDVALLRKNGILEHAFGSDEELAGIINRLTSGTFHHLPWELKNVYKEADIHCKGKWNSRRATLLRDYFGHPWAAMATLAAVLGLCCTIIQTFFSAYSYFRPRSAP